jgi:uncharacterized protein YcbK (DUF882 family)
MRLRPRSLLGMGRGVLLASGALLVAGTGDASATNVSPLRNARVVERQPPRPLDLPAAPSPAVHRSFAQLEPVEVKNRNTNAVARLRLYDDRGAIDQGALRGFMRVACSIADAPDRKNGDVAEPLDPRLIQLVFRAAYHFRSSSITLVSATRRGAHGKHGSGAAIDFQLAGVPAGALAAYTRTYPRAGIGIYTHPKTQYVHVDVRGHSYHWVDRSPPGVSWRETLLADPTQATRDASYEPAMDLPD